MRSYVTYCNSYIKFRISYIEEKNVRIWTFFWAPCNKWIAFEYSKKIKNNCGGLIFHQTFVLFLVQVTLNIEGKKWKNILSICVLMKFDIWTFLTLMWWDKTHTKPGQDTIISLSAISLSVTIRYVDNPMELPLLSIRLLASVLYHCKNNRFYHIAKLSSSWPVQCKSHPSGQVDLKHF